MPSAQLFTTKVTKFHEGNPGKFDLRVTSRPFIVPGLATHLVRKSLLFAIAWPIHEPRPCAGLQCDVLRDDGTGVREIEPVERLLQHATGVVDINRTTRGRRTRNRLRHKKQLVNRIELDISTAEKLLFPPVGQNFW